MTDFQPPSRDAAGRYEPIVLVVDDDASLREALRNLLRSVGLRVEVFASAAAFLESDLPPAAGCLILDVRLPGQSGLDLQAELIREEIPIPVVFITGHAEVPMSVRAMKAGAIDLLTKPFHDQDLLDAVTAALDRDRKRRREEEKTSGLQASFESLTPRERLIMSCVTEGRMNKQIAHEIGVSGITVKIHRGNVMRKMAAKSLAELVAALGNQLPERRFVTIVGPGGIGKTTVALAAATTFRGRYRHGVWFVDLAPVAEGSRVPSALAARSAYCDKTGRSGCQSGLVPQRQGDAARHRQLRARRACGRPIMRGSVQQRSGRSYSRDQPRTAARLGRTGTALAGAAVPADLRTFDSRGGDGFPGSRAMSCTKILSSRRSIFQHANGLNAGACSASPVLRLKQA